MAGTPFSIDVVEDRRVPSGRIPLASRGAMSLWMWTCGCLEPNPSFSPGSETDTSAMQGTTSTLEGTTGDDASGQTASDDDGAPSSTDSSGPTSSGSTTSSDAREPTDCPASAYVCEHFDDPAVVETLTRSDPGPNVTFIADAAAGAGALQFDYWETDAEFVTADASYPLPLDLGPVVHARFFARRSAATDTSGAFIQILSLSPASTSKRVSVDIQESNQPAIYLNPDDAEPLSARAPSDEPMVADEWVCLELEFELSLDAGGAGLRVDGTSAVQTMQTYDTQFDDPLTRVVFGVATAVPHEFAVDELVVAPEPIGCWKDE